MMRLSLGLTIKNIGWLIPHMMEKLDQYKKILVITLIHISIDYSGTIANPLYDPNNDTKLVYI
jgi:hypothetical protein